MSKHPLAATAEGMSAQTARDLLSDMEDDMHLVRDHALVLNNALTGTGDLPVKLRHALAHTSCQLLGIGEKLSAFHEAMHDALRSPEASANDADRPAASNAANGNAEDMEAAFLNLARTMANVHSFMSENMRRTTNTQGQRVFEIREDNGDQFFSMIYIADRWAEGVAKEIGQ